MKFATILLLLLATLKTIAGSELLHYVVRAPLVKSEKAPMIILLHGLGSNERDLFSFAEQLPGRFLVISARAPLTISNGSYAWYPLSFADNKAIYNYADVSAATQTLLTFIAQLKKKYAVDDGVYLCGFSQGAIMSLNVALTHPDLVKGIAVMSGRLQKELVPLIDKNHIRQLKMFASHGIDDGLFPVAGVKRDIAYLKSLGIAVTYYEYPEGHTISHQMLNDLVSWLNDNP